MAHVWLPVLSVVFIMALALGVIALVVSWRKPEGGYVQWYADSFSEMRKDHLSTDSFVIAHQDTELDQIFSTFEEYDGEAYLSAQEINDNYIDFKASPGAQKVVVTAEEIIMRTQQIAVDSSKRAAKAATPVAQSAYRKARSGVAKASSSAASKVHRKGSAASAASAPRREKSAASAKSGSAAKSAPTSAPSAPEGGSPRRPHGLRTKHDNNAA